MSVQDSEFGVIIITLHLTDIAEINAQLQVDYSIMYMYTWNENNSSIVCLFINKTLNCLSRGFVSMKQVT